MHRSLSGCMLALLLSLLVAAASCPISADARPWSVVWRLPLPCAPGHFHFVETHGPYLSVCVPPEGAWMVNRATGAVAWRAHADYACASVRVSCLGDRALLFSGMEHEVALLRVPSGAPVWRRRPPSGFDWAGVWPLRGRGSSEADEAAGGQPMRFLLLATEAAMRPGQCRLEVAEADGRMRTVAVLDLAVARAAYLGGDEVYLVGGAGGVHATDIATGHDALRYAVGDTVAYVLEDGPRICVGGLRGIYAVDPTRGRLVWQMPRANAMCRDDPVLAEGCLAFADPDGLTLVDTATGKMARVTGMNPLTWARPVVAGRWVYFLAKGNRSESSCLWRVDRQAQSAELLASVEGKLADHWLPLQADPDAAYIALADEQGRPQVIKLAPAR